MKKILLVVLVALNLSVSAQQWQWAVTADSVYGNQDTRMICRNTNNVFALLIQNGHSIINNTYLDSGNVIVKITTGGQIVWAKHYNGTIRSIYANDNGDIYFIGIFSGVLNFCGITLISHGGKDIFYGELDTSGNVLWVSSAGGLQDDSGNGIITDAQNNLFLAGRITDDYYIGTLLRTGNTGLGTYLLRCDLSGNYISAYTDSLPYINTGEKFRTRIDGTLYLSTHYDYYPCPYVCDGYIIFKINSFDFSITNIGQLYAFEYLWSWAINNDSTIAANYNTCSHYEDCYDIFTITPSNAHLVRKGLGNGYDGNFIPYLTKGIADEIIVGGYFDRGWSNFYDTLWYDNLFLLPDTTLNVMIGGVDTSNQYTWVLRSEGIGASVLTDLVSDEQGHTYCGGRYNATDGWNTSYDTLPEPVTFGSTVLPAENHYSRFFIAGSSGPLIITSTQSQIQNPLSGIQISPNPSSGIFTIHTSSKNINTKICVYDLLGNCVMDASTSSAATSTEIDLSAQAKGIYFVKMQTGERMFNQKIVVE